MTWTTTYGSTTHHDRVVILGNNERAIMVTLTGPLTVKRKAEVQRQAALAFGGNYSPKLTDRELAGAYDRHAWCEYRAVKLRFVSIRNRDTGEVRHEWDLTHDRGSRSINELIQTEI